MALTFIPVKAAGAELFNQEISSTMDAWLVPYVQELQANLPAMAMMLKMAPLAGLLSGGANLPIPSVEKQDMYLSWKKGTQDFVIDPVGLDDGVQTVSKMQPLWGLYSPDDMLAHGGPMNAMLGFTGSTPDIDIFIQDFIVLSLGAGVYDDARRKPLRDYLMTLNAPVNPNMPSAADITAGQSLFTSKGCESCHNGPNKSGTRLFTYAEMGVDDALIEWADKYADGNSEVPELFKNGSVLTHKVKAPKLVGMWSQKLFLHNGSVDGLEALFCLTPKPMRPTNTTPVFSDKGHMMTCVPDATNPSGTLTDVEKSKLIAYLRSL
jgi:cytochrome c551/c552